MLVALRGITKRFGAVRALADVELEIAAGEVVALLGDNGAGKSTVVKILAGVLAPDAGTIEVGGQAVAMASPADSRSHGIATVYQDLALCDNLDVVSNLYLGCEEHGITLHEEQMEQRSWELLRRLSAKIPSVRTPIAALSGGQRQTVAIARSLLGDPSVVILDEPTAALGVEQTAEVLSLIGRLRETGHGVLLITHNMVDARAVADRVCVLRLGRNNGTFAMAQTTDEQIIAAITGAGA